MINCVRVCTLKKKWGLILSVFLLLLGVAAGSAADEPMPDAAAKLGVAPAGVLTAKWKPLLDPKLSSWELWMGVPHKTVTGLPPGTPVSEDGHEGTPLGLNNDPLHVFTIQTKSGESVLHITGQIFGGLTTLNSYSNYHFRCQVRWGQLKWEPKLQAKRDSGILYHCTGPHGAFWKIWKRCLEFQVEETNMGDLYCLSGTNAEATVMHDPKDPNNKSYDPAGTLEKVGGLPHLKGSFEVPNGEWNTLDLYTLGQTSVAVVNGHVDMVLRNTMANVDGAWVPLSSGQIQLQSEGAEVEYRRVEIQALKEYPPKIQAVAKFTPAELGSH